MMTENSIYRTAVEDYRQMLTDDVSPADAEQDLLLIINNYIREYNTGKEKNERLQYVKVLPNAVVADIVPCFYIFKNITWTPKNGDLFVYQTDGPNAGIYVDDDEVIDNIIQQFNYKVSGMDIKDIKRMMLNHAEKAQVNDDRNLIPVNNGIFHFDSKTLTDFTPDIVFTTKARVDYKTDAKNVVIHNDTDDTDWDVESWMKEISDDDEITNLLWQVVGSVIRPYERWDKAICLYSTLGCNGKGTLCQLIKNMCGEGYYASVPFDAFADRFGLENLLYCSAIITDENIPRGYIRDTKTLKAVITNDTFLIDRKFKTCISVRFNGIMVQCINELPKFADKSDSLYRRLIIVPFTKSFTGAERKYIKADYVGRREVLEYVLYKVLNMNYTSFSVPQRCDAELAEYKNYNDPVRDFLNEFLDVFQWTLVPYAFLYDLYKEWFVANTPNGQIQGKRGFINDVKMAMNCRTDWICTSASVPTRNHMNAFEPLILQYNLKDWQSHSYKGNNDIKKCEFVRKSSYIGILKV